MVRAYKTEIQPSKEQVKRIRQTMGVARYVENMYIARNQEVYKDGDSFVSGMDFSNWLNHMFVPNNLEKAWIKGVYAKSTRQAIMNTEKAFKRLSDFPKFAKENQQKTKFYFVKNDKKMITACERHRIKVPTLGWIKLKEKGYIPTHDGNHMIKSGTISKKADRYYISVLVEVPDKIVEKPMNEGIGIDLGIKELAVCSNGTVKKNINNSARVRKLEKQLKREQRKLSRKYESEKQLIQDKKIKKGETTRKNIDKQIFKVQKLYQKLANIRKDYQNKFVSELAKNKPAYITIEDLNVKGMMKNKHLSRVVAQQGFYAIRKKIEDSCGTKGIQLRMVDRFYPSSKRCHACGHKKVNLELSERIYRCDCGYVADRDFNASLNLRDAKEYKILA